MSDHAKIKIPRTWTCKKRWLIPRPTTLKILPSIAKRFVSKTGLFHSKVYFYYKKFLLTYKANIIDISLNGKLFSEYFGNKKNNIIYQYLG